MYVLGVVATLLSGRRRKPRKGVANMKLSEAILAGCRVTKPCHGHYVDGDSACLIGAAVIGANIGALRLELLSKALDREKEFPLLALPAIYAEDPYVSRRASLGDFFETCYEIDGWSREKCAEIIARIEVMEEELAYEWFMHDLRLQQPWIVAVSSAEPYDSLLQ
jgi:hypothetical protein